MDGPLLASEPAKGRTLKRSKTAVLAVALITAGALVSIMAQRIGVTPFTEMFSVALPTAVGTRMSQATATPPMALQRLGSIAQAKRKDQVVLLKDVDKVGKQGELKSVKPGFMRNYLFPRGLAGPVTESVLNQIAKEKAKEEDRKAKIKEDAQKIKTALATIGKFTVKKKVGEESKIFGSVTPADVVEAIKAQTELDLPKADVTLPDDISTLGTYECTIKLHPQVVGEFKVVVAKD